MEIHAVGARLLREYADAIGLDRAFTIHDREDSADLMNLVRHDLGFSKTKKRFPMKGTCLAIYSRTVNAELPLEDVLGSFFPWCGAWEAELRTLFAAYVVAKQQQHVLDYDDLLLYWAQMMQEPSIAVDVSSRFDHVLVDEYQDTNRLQASVLLALKPNGRGLTVVGDDAQSIYSFRAATVRNILDFPGQFSPPAEIVTLDQNYRCTQPILKAANAVIDLAEERFTKNLWSERCSAQRPQLVSVRDEADQARYVVEKVLENREAGLALKSQAILFRASHHSGPLEVELTRRNIPFVKFGGLKFLEAAHIKDVLAFLRWAENPRDRVAGFRVIQLLPGAGPATAARVLDRVAEQSDPSRGLSEFTPPAAAAEYWPSFVDAVQRVHGKSAQRVRPGTLTSAIRSRRPRSTTDTEYESGIEGSPTFAAIRMLRVGSNASPFGLTPTAILKAFCSSQGANPETVFSPRLLVKTRPRVSDTSAPATPMRSGIDSMYRSRSQSITSTESLLVCAT